MASFEEVAASFWHADNKHGMLPPLTDGMVAVAERELGVALPQELLRLLRLQNGGVVGDEWDACPSGPDGDEVPFEYLSGIGAVGQARVITLLDTPYLLREWGLPEKLVLLSGDGHTWVALDYRAGGEPAVTWLDSELGQEFQLAPDFRSFVERLHGSS